MSAERTAGLASADEAPAPVEELAGPSAAVPLAPGERISSVDVLRGVALLGILLMNMPDMGMAAPGPGVDLRPSAHPSAADLAYWAASHVLFEGKMRGLFSLLFGAGVVLLTSRLEARGAGEETADVYSRRMLWLVAFGLIHAYFIWAGDILFDYGVLGLALFPLRKLRPRALIAAGVALQAVLVAQALWSVAETRREEAKARDADRSAAAGKPLTEEQRDARKAWEERLKQMNPSPERLAKKVREHRAGYATMFARRAGEVAGSQASSLYDWSVFDAGGMMLVGMGLMKLGVLSAARSLRFYTLMAAAGYAVGVPIGVWTAYRVWSSGFDPFVIEWANVWDPPARLAVTLGNVGLILLAFRAGVLPGLAARLAAVGRTALTNYLGTSVACTLLFNGYGLGLFDRLSRHQLLAPTAAVWAAQLLISPLWLRHFRYGPAEWVWRSLAYGKAQPFRGAAG